MKIFLGKTAPETATWSPKSSKPEVGYPLTVVDIQNKSIIDPSDYSLGASGQKREANQ